MSEQLSHKNDVPYGAKAAARKQQHTAEMKILYIESAERIIRSDGITGLTIRRLAEETGYNSATMYSYFEDLDELIMYATFKFRKEYLFRLSTEIMVEMSARAQYLKMYEIYCDLAFSDPEIFYNMYYGKYRYRLRTAYSEYYRLFPEEYVPQVPLIRDMFNAGDVYQSELAMLRHLVRSGELKEENLEIVANMIGRISSSYMEEIYRKHQADVEVFRQELMGILNHLLDQN